MGERAGVATVDVETQVGTASEQAAQIATATEQLAASIRESAANTEQIANGAGQNTSSAIEIAHTAESVSKQSDELRTITSCFQT